MAGERGTPCHHAVTRKCGRALRPPSPGADTNLGWECSAEQRHAPWTPGRVASAAGLAGAQPPWRLPATGDSPSPALVATSGPPVAERPRLPTISLADIAASGGAAQKSVPGLLAPVTRERISPAIRRASDRSMPPRRPGPSAGSPDASEGKARRQTRRSWASPSWCQLGRGKRPHRCRRWWLPGRAKQMAVPNRPPWAQPSHAQRSRRTRPSPAWADSWRTTRLGGRAGRAGAGLQVGAWTSLVPGRVVGPQTPAGRSIRRAVGRQRRTPPEALSRPFPVAYRNAPSPAGDPGPTAPARARYASGAHTGVSGPAIFRGHSHKMRR